MNNDILADISRELKSQDNAITADPLFIVYDKKRLYGMDEEFSDEFDWVHQDGPVADCEEAKFLEEAYQNDEETPSEWNRFYYVEVDHFKQAFFTRKSAEEYIRRNSYNMESPHVYVESLHRNGEMKAVRGALMEIPSVERNSDE